MARNAEKRDLKTGTIDLLCGYEKDRHFWSKIWAMDGARPAQSQYLVVPVRLWRRTNVRRFFAQEWAKQILRLLKLRSFARSKHNPWIVKSSAAQHLESDADSLRESAIAFVSQLRWERNWGIAELANVFNIFRRYVAYLVARINIGTTKQQSWIFKRKLLLDSKIRSVAESQELCLGKYPSGADDCGRCSSRIRSKFLCYSEPHKKGLSARTHSRQILVAA